MASGNSTVQEPRFKEYFTVTSLTDRELNRLFSKIRLDPGMGCWEWTASGKNGYGNFYFRGVGTYVHRLMYAWVYSQIPNGCGKSVPTIDHICQNRRCCNPFHLRLISQRENILAGNGVSAIAARTTHCKHGHLLDGVRSTGKRFCKTCVREFDRRRQGTEHRKAKAREYYWHNREACLARVKARKERLKRRMTHE